MDIFESFPSTSTLILIGLPLLYLLGTPLLILATFRTEAFPTIEPVPADDPLPEVVRQHFFEVHESMTRLGFSNEGTFFLPQAVTNVKSLIVVFLNRAESTGAVSAVVYSDQNGIWNLQERFTEFCTRFDDDSEINTGNQKTLGAFPIPPSYLSTQHPRIQSVEDLFAAHQALKRHYALRRRPVNRLDTLFDGDVAAFISAGMTAEFEHAKACGYLRYIGGAHDGFTAAMQDSPYRPPASLNRPQYGATFVGAYLMAWKQLWPMKPFFAYARHRRDRRLLDDTGFELPSKNLGWS
ncbi:hypothetical protein Rcae01_00586 [Novipirellula caenicola]|uniref:Uncharacterized protein n=2 Tax=Novipirellula caenicola TaxID=1536901 RepID=A0ABP9VLJ6_9BACT